MSGQSCLSEGWWEKVSYNMSGVNIYSDGKMTEHSNGCSPCIFLPLTNKKNNVLIQWAPLKLLSFVQMKKKKGEDGK